MLFTPILGLLKAEEQLSVYFTDYYRIMLITYPCMVLGTILGMFIRVDGKPQICMLVSIMGCILNVIMDYIFVAVIGLGVRGSANPIRLYSLDEITEIFGKLGLRICNSFADFSGKPSSDNDIQLMVYSIRE